MAWESVAWAIDAGLRETLLFAAVGIVVGGIDDFVVDLAYLIVKCARWRRPRTPAIDLAAPFAPRRLAVFVPAWDEAAVIGAMLRTTLARFDHSDYRLYVGAYPNDRATIDAVAAVAEADRRVRLVIGDRAGPTTKGDCLNTLWRALERDERAGAPCAAGIVLHDAEDVVHPAELALFVTGQ